MTLSIYLEWVHDVEEMTEPLCCYLSELHDDCLLNIHDNRKASRLTAIDENNHTTLISSLSVWSCLVSEICVTVSTDDDAPICLFLMPFFFIRITIINELLYLTLSNAISGMTLIVYYEILEKCSARFI